jgi:hypothetical protein
VKKQLLTYLPWTAAVLVALIFASYAVWLSLEDTVSQAKIIFTGVTGTLVTAMAKDWASLRIRYWKSFAVTVSRERDTNSDLFKHFLVVITNTGSRTETIGPVVFNGHGDDIRLHDLKLDLVPGHTNELAPGGCAVYHAPDILSTYTDKGYNPTVTVYDPHGVVLVRVQGEAVRSQLHWPTVLISGAVRQ